jgi:molybdopterin biosynthesis enzyme
MHAADDAYHLGRHDRVALAGFLSELWRSNVILTAGGVAFGHKGVPKRAISRAKGEEVWMQ